MLGRGDGWEAKGRLREDMLRTGDLINTDAWAAAEMPDLRLGDSYDVGGGRGRDEGSFSPGVVIFVAEVAARLPKFTLTVGFCLTWGDIHVG